MSLSLRRRLPFLREIPHRRVQPRFYRPGGDIENPTYEQVTTGKWGYGIYVTGADKAFYNTTSLTGATALNNMDLQSECAAGKPQPRRDLYAWDIIEKLSQFRLPNIAEDDFIEVKVGQIIDV